MTRNHRRASGREEHAQACFTIPLVMGQDVGHGVRVATTALLQAGDEEEKGDQVSSRADKDGHAWDLHRV